MYYIVAGYLGYSGSILDSDVFYPVLVFYDYWGLRAGVKNFFILWIIALPFIGAISYMSDPIVALHWLFQRSFRLLSIFQRIGGTWWGRKGI